MKNDQALSKVFDRYPTDDATLDRMINALTDKRTGYLDCYKEEVVPLQDDILRLQSAKDENESHMKNVIFNLRSALEKAKALLYAQAARGHFPPECLQTNGGEGLGFMDTVLITTKQYQ